MATLYVRNFPDALYETVQELAREDGQSISAEVVELVDDAVQRVQRKRKSLQAMARIEARYSQFRPSVDGKDSLDLLREDRDR